MPVNRPNIILIHTDQHRADCLSIAGHPELITPNLDGLALRGTRFTNAYTPAPVCSPARHSLLTGCSPATNGVLSNQPARIARPDATLPALLRRAGYQALHVGRSMHQHPGSARYGFDYCVGQPHKDAYSIYRARMPELSQTGEFTNFPHLRDHGLPLDGYTARDWPYDEFLHETNHSVNKAIEMIDGRDRDCPLFLSVGIVAPHPPLVPPRFYYDRYRGMDLTPPVVGKWVEDDPYERMATGVYSGRIPLGGEAIRAAMAAYYGLVNHVDDQLHNLLRRIGYEKQDTYIIFLSDHGEMLGDHGLFGKRLPFAASVRIPLIVTGPGIPAGRTVDRPVTLEDILPTCMEMADLPTPDHVEGKSLFDLIRDGEAPWRQWVHSEQPDVPGSEGWHMLAGESGKYIRWSRSGREMLFDLEADPAELHDLSGDPARSADMDRWRGRLAEHLRDRPEGYVQDGELRPVDEHPPLLPWAVPV